MHELVSWTFDMSNSSKLLTVNLLILLGDEIVCVVKRARPINPNLGGQAAAQKVKKGDVRHALVVRTKKEMARPDGRYIRFDDNACILLNNKKEPLGTRVLGVVAAELKQKNWMKAVSLAPRII